MSEYNRISKVLETEELNKISECITTLKSELDFLQNLTPRERKNLPKINSANKIFAEDSIHILEGQPAWIPPALTAEEAKKDLRLYEQPEPVILELDGLVRRLKDTQMIAGSEVYRAALSVYSLANASRKIPMDGAQTAYELLKTRFTQSINSTPTTPDTDTETDTNIDTQN